MAGRNIPTDIWNTLDNGTPYAVWTAVEVMFATPYRVASAPQDLTILGESFPSGFVVVESENLDAYQEITFHLPNVGNEISSAVIAAGNKLLQRVRIYEYWVHPGTGAYLGLHVVHDGTLTEVDIDGEIATCRSVARWNPVGDIINRIASFWCCVEMKGELCGYRELGLASVARASNAYGADGKVCASNVPHFADGKFGLGLACEAATTNLLTANQASVETDTTGFTAVSSTMTRLVTDRAWTGGAVLRAACPGSAVGEGVETSLVGVTPSKTYGASVWVFLELQNEGALTFDCVPVLKLSEYTSADALVGTTTGAAVAAVSGQWVLLTVQRAFGSTGVKAKITLVTSAKSASTFWSDGWQLEEDGPSTWMPGGTSRAAEDVSFNPNVPVATFVRASGTIAAWVLLTNRTTASFSYQSIMAMDSGGNSRLIMMIYTGGGGQVLAVADRDSAGSELTGLNAGGTVPVGVWTHVAYTWGADGHRLYFNGAETGSNASTRPIPDPTVMGLCHLGSAAAGHQLRGVLDEFRIYGAQLSATEVAALAAGTYPIGAERSDLRWYLPAENTLRHVEGFRTTECAHTYAACSALGNQARFEGLYWLPPKGTIYRWRVRNDTAASSNSGNASSTTIVRVHGFSGNGQQVTLPVIPAVYY